MIKRSFLHITAGLVAFASVLSAQNGWYTPATDSPELLVGYMRFHVALADAIEQRPALADAPHDVFGVSVAEFRGLAARFRPILADLEDSARRPSPAPAPGTAAQELLAVDRFAGALRSVPEISGLRIRQYMNGPFRASMRSQFVQGGAK